MWRPAWRIIHTGVRSTASPRAARSSRGASSVAAPAADTSRRGDGALTLDATSELVRAREHSSASIVQGERIPVIVPDCKLKEAGYRQLRRAAAAPPRSRTTPQIASDAPAT